MTPFRTGSTVPIAIQVSEYLKVRCPGGNPRVPSCTWIAIGLLQAALTVLLPPQVAVAQAPIRLSVDATAVGRRLIHSHVEIPVSGFEANLSYPLWSPGDHAPFQHAGQITELHFHAGTKAGAPLLPWRRDLVDQGLFHIPLPPGTTALTADFDVLLPTPGDALADSSAHLLILRWKLYVLYTAAQPVSSIPVQANLTLPRGWQYSTALPAEAGLKTADGISFTSTNLETLIDSPVLTGEFMRKADLARDTQMVVAADDPADLPTEAALTPFRALITQAHTLFGSQPFRDYKFLVTLSKYATPGSGFEHSASSDTRLDPGFFKHPGGDILAHEYVHAWNGKYRRPADLYSLDFQQPERTDLLWVYESLTNYFGIVLAARSGLLGTPAETRERLAATAAMVDHETGRTWRNLQDSADSVPLTMQELFTTLPGWNSWLRVLDYYDEGTLLWLEADSILDQQSQGKHSLTDFAHIFFAAPVTHTPGINPIRLYTADEVFRTLNQIAPYDWQGFFHERLTSLSPRVPLGGYERFGWRLVYTAEPNTLLAPRRAGLATALYSIGLAIGDDQGTISDILRGSPADAAGLAPGMRITTVNGKAWSAAGLVSAIADTAKPAIHLQAELAGQSRDYTLIYQGGPKNPHLERIPDKPDLLTALLAPQP